MAIRAFLPLNLIVASVILGQGHAIVEQCQACRRVSVSTAIPPLNKIHFQKHPANACPDVQAELLDRLGNEKPKDPLDLRNRLDSQGKRYGKVIEFRCVASLLHDMHTNASVELTHQASTQ